MNIGNIWRKTPQLKSIIEEYRRFLSRCKMEKNVGGGRKIAKKSFVLILNENHHSLSLITFREGNIQARVDPTIPYLGFRLRGIIILDITQMSKSRGKMLLRHVTEGISPLN